MEKTVMKKEYNAKYKYLKMPCCVIISKRETLVFTIKTI